MNENSEELGRFILGDIYVQGERIAII